MKALAIAALALTATAYAQAPTRPPNVGPRTPPPTAVQPTPPPSAQRPQPQSPQPTGTPVEPKHSEATATLRAIEAEKATLLSQQQSLANQVNTLMAGLRDKITSKDADAQAEQEAIRKENGWDDSYIYSPPQPMPDGTTSPGKWQHIEKPKK